MIEPMVRGQVVDLSASHAGPTSSLEVALKIGINPQAMVCGRVKMGRPFNRDSLIRPLKIQSA